MALIFTRDTHLSGHFMFWRLKWKHFSLLRDVTESFRFSISVMLTRLYYSAKGDCSLFLWSCMHVYCPTCLFYRCTLNHRLTFFFRISLQVFTMLFDCVKMLRLACGIAKIFPTQNRASFLHHLKEVQKYERSNLDQEVKVCYKSYKLSVSIPF